MYRNHFPWIVLIFSAFICALFASCVPYSDSRRTIAQADSLEALHQKYSDTAALTEAIESMDNVWGKIVARDVLAKAYFYRGRNYELQKDLVCAAANDYISCDRLRPNDDLLRGRANSCMAFICAIQEDYALACVFCERALNYLEEAENEYYYAHALLNMSSSELNAGNLSKADSLWKMASTYEQQMDSAFYGRLMGVRGSYFLTKGQPDSALYYYERLPIEKLRLQQQAFYWKQWMLCYYALGENDRAEEYAKKVIDRSDEASYIAQAYSTLLHIHIQSDSVNVPLEYAKPRIEAGVALRSEHEKYTAAVEKLRIYAENPYPYLPWLAIVLLMSVSGIVLICILYFAVYNFKMLLQNKDQDIQQREQQMLQQKIEHKQQMHSIEQQYAHENVGYLHQVSLFLNRVESLRRSYPEPPIRWQQYNNLYHDTKAVFAQLVASVRKYQLTEREITYCIYLILYKDAVSKQIADYMCYSPTGIGTFKQRVSHKLGCSAADLYDTCVRLAAKTE